ncbi:hypothetical protein HanPSC8_Chr07g0272351 [Helianthus annuus]|nr:hypothetical protein HanPSC8_Chr07g0272351 [Helianthus annuus]
MLFSTTCIICKDWFNCMYYKRVDSVQNPLEPTKSPKPKQACWFSQIKPTI